MLFDGLDGPGEGATLRAGSNLPKLTVDYKDRKFEIKYKLYVPHVLDGLDVPRGACTTSPVSPA